MPSQNENDPLDVLKKAVAELPEFDVPVLKHAMTPEQAKQLYDAAIKAIQSGNTIAQVFGVMYNVARFFIPLPPKKD